MRITGALEVAGGFEAVDDGGGRPGAEDDVSAQSSVGDAGVVADGEESGEFGRADPDAFRGVDPVSAVSLI